MPYKCEIKDCGEVLPNLLRGKIHVYLEHGKSWKKARTYLRYMRDHERLPDPIEPWEHEKETKAQWQKRSFENQAAILRKIVRTEAGETPQLEEMRPAEKSAYKPYLNKTPKKSHFWRRK